MHPNQAFRKTSRQDNVSFVQGRSFGALSINGENGPLVSHIPFLLSDDGSYLEAHLVRSNPIVGRLIDPLTAVMAVSGGDAYVSPDWYGIDNQVPTWNYVAVHIRGELSRLEPDELPGILDRLSANMEERLLPKLPWTTEKIDQAVYEAMQRQIVPIGMRVLEIEGTWKLSQNKPDAAVYGAQTGINASKTGMGLEQISDLMRDAKLPGKI